MSAPSNLRPLVLEGFNAGGLVPGGQLMFTTDVENYPGFVEKVTGPDLMQRFRGQAIRNGAELVTQDVSKVDFKSRPFKVWSDGQLHLAERGNHLLVDGEQDVALLEASHRL